VAGDRWINRAKSSTVRSGSTIPRRLQRGYGYFSDWTNSDRHRLPPRETVCFS
jgi:hypothetical protein